MSRLGFLGGRVSCCTQRLVLRVAHSWHKSDNTLSCFVEDRLQMRFSVRSNQHEICSAMCHSKEAELATTQPMYFCPYRLGFVLVWIHSKADWCSVCLTPGANQTTLFHAVLLGKNPCVFACINLLSQSCVLCRRGSLRNGYRI